MTQHLGPVKTTRMAEDRKRKKELRKGYHTLDAVDPSTGQSMTVFLSRDQAAFWAKRGDSFLKLLAYLVPEALTKPIAVFKGVREQERCSNWLAYVSQPPFTYEGVRGIKRRAPEGMVFVVYLDEDRVIANFRWREDKILTDFSDDFREKAL